MKLEHQVSSLELSKKLKELGVKQKSLFYWENKWAGSSDEDAGKDVISYGNSGYHTMRLCSAFTVAELGEMLPDNIKHKGNSYWMKTNKSKLSSGEIYHVVYYEDNHPIYGGIISFTADTEADARAKMLVYLLENKLIML